MKTQHIVAITPASLTFACSRTDSNTSETRAAAASPPPSAPDSPGTPDPGTDNPSTPPAFESKQIEDFHRDGYLLVRGLFTEEEIGLVGETARNDHAMDRAASSMDDGEGHDVRLSL